MISRDCLPSEPLREYIRIYRLRHFVLDQNRPLSFKPFPPRPEQCIVFYPRGYEVIANAANGDKTQRPRAVISGQYTHRINRYNSYPEFLMIEADLQPGALHRLTGYPCKELANKDEDAEAFFGPAIRKVADRLGSAGTYAEMIAIVEAFFCTLIARQKKDSFAVDRVLSLVTHQPDGFSVDALARQAYLSPRQLERKLEERIGVSPKTFLRICRFNQSYWMRLKKPALDWLRIAMACGYSDYQHLVKDYKDFANATPNILFSEEGKAPGKVLGLTRD